MTDTTLSLILAADTQWCIGKNGSIPWRLKRDMRRFKKITMGHPIIMGRKTYESIGRPLPGRTTIVLTENRDYEAPDGVLVAHSISKALARAMDCEGSDEVFVCGGAGVYASAIMIADKLYLTRVHCESDGDTSVPSMISLTQEWVEVEREHIPADSDNEHESTFIVRRKSKWASNPLPS